MIKPWHLIVAGIAMNIAASGITHITIENSLARLGNIRAQITKLDTQIESLWQQNIEAERKKEFAALYYMKTPASPINPNATEPDANLPPNTLLTEYFNSISRDLPTAMQALPNNEGEYLARISRYQVDVRNQIDDIYLNRIQLNQALPPIEKDINFYRSLSLFLQLMGLILVLSKDLARKH